MSEKETKTVHELLETAVQENPDSEALYDLTRRMTYKQLEEESNILAAYLSSKGIRQGDKVGLCLPNWHETVLLYFAASKIGAVLVPFNPKYRLHEAKHIISDSAVKLLFVCETFEEAIGIESISSIVSEIVTVRFQKEGLECLPAIEGQSFDGALPDVHVDPVHDIFCILYTSGSTGLPKGAMITHQNIVLSGYAFFRELETDKNDVQLITTPIFHVFAMGGPGFMGALVSQSRMILQPAFSPEEALQLIEQEKVTVHNGVPTIYILELNHPNFDKYDLSSLRIGMTGGAPCPEETLQAIKKKMKMKFCTGYGLTEVGSITMTKMDDEDEKVLETVGKPITGAEVKIVNDIRETVSVGEVGEIACKGFGIIKGYLNAPEKNKESFDEDGWFYTGDLGFIDEEGYLRFAGRKKEMIIRGGYNIYPREIEEVLYQHDQVAEAAVIGLPDKIMGEEVCAVIKTNENTKVSVEELQDFLKSRLAKYKIPTQFQFTDKFPMTASGKIQKIELKDKVMETIEN